MKKTLFLRRLVLLPAVAMALYAQAQITPVSLRIEHRPGDVLVDASLAKNTALQNESAQKPVPRFSWINKADAAAQAEKQKAYRICVATSVEALEAGEPDAWDSKKVKSPESYLIPYKGKPLKEGESYYWRVMTWNSKGKASQWSEVQKFSVGLSPESWKAKWIGAPWVGEEPQYSIKENKDVHDPSPVPMLRKAFEVKDGIKSAKAYVTGLGYFELYVNGTKPSDDVLVPDFTNYGPRPDLKHHPHISIDEKSSGFQVSYLLYDITNLLRSGKNAVGAMIGGGYYDSRGSIIGPFGSPRFICQIEITYNDGSRQTVVSDESWKAHESAIVTCDLYAGENYDARKEIPGWCEPSFDDSSWKNVALRNAPGGVLTAHDTPADKVMETFKPISFKKNDDGSYTVDFGEVISGWVHFKGVKGAEGQKLTIKYESEYPKEVSYTFKDSEPIDYTPKFSWQVFRTVTVKGAELTADMLTAEAVYTSMDVDCEFSSSNELFNKINKIWQRTEKDNIHSGVESDCPHREKLPWLEQLHLMFGSLQYTFDMFSLYEKMLDDMAMAQLPNGLVPDIAPEYALFREAFRDSPEWGSAFVLVPLYLYEYYGDGTMLRKHYEAMGRYVDYLTSKADDHILKHGLGDWFDIGPKMPGRAQLSSLAATATPIYYMDALAMVKGAELLGKKKDAERWQKLADAIRTSYNEKFFHKEGCYYDRNSQTANSIALCAGLVDPEYRQGVLDNVVKDIRSRNNGLTGGDVGYTYILRALEAGGRSDVIFDMNSRYDVYGYGYMLAQGATALPESWQVVPIKSHNHFMLGHLMQWLYTHVGGIRRDTGALAYKRSVIRPEAVGDLTMARVSFESPYGQIRSEWSKGADGSFELLAEVPANTTSTVWLPAAEDAAVFESNLPVEKVAGIEYLGYKEGCKVYAVGSGTYRFDVRPQR